MTSDDSSHSKTLPDPSGLLSRVAAQIAEGASRLVGHVMRKTDRPLRSSEVLFLELLQIALRRNWRRFASDLLAERSRQHEQVLKRAIEVSKQAAEPATSGASDDEDPLVSLLGSSLATAVDERQAVLKDTESAQAEEGVSVDVTIARSRDLLDSFATSLIRLPDVLRDRIDRDIETRHRRFVILGSAEHDGDDDLRAQMQSMREDSSEPLHPHAVAGLSLSGGGIRSASFAVGALQALSRAAVLPAFDYISSVSGGGYASSWLAAWAYRHGDGIHGVDRELFRSLSSDSGPLRWLRRHSSYLAPRPGLTSSDGWALFVAYLSNWLPILGLVVLALMTLLLLPHALSAAADALGNTGHHWLKAVAMLLTGLLLVTYMGLVRRLTLFYRVPARLSRFPAGLPPLMFWGALVVTLAISVTMPLLSDLVSTHGWRAVGGWPFAADSIVEPHATIFVFWSAVSLVSWMIAAFLSTETGQFLSDEFRIRVLRLPLNPSGPLCRNKTPIPVLMIAMVVSSGLATLMIAALMPLARTLMAHPWALVAFGPFAIMTVFAASELCGLMLTLNYQRDVDRAWAARVGAWMLACVTAWTVLCALSLGVSAMLHDHGLRELRVQFFVAVLLLSAVALLATWRASGRIGLLYFAAMAGVLLPLLHLGLTYITAPDANGRSDAGSVWQMLVITFSLTLLLSLFANVNRYSLHAIYKEGLVRTFLGASRRGPRNPNVRAPEDVEPCEEPQFRTRRPDPVTNIDDEDNPALAWLRSRPGRELPILLLNAAVNGSSPTDVEGRVPRQWPFTFSQHFSGSPADGIGYAPTADFFSRDVGNGLSLGAAMAVSGAAMSPTSGRTTHALKAFVLGILNARLGIWIGNPSHPPAVRRHNPPLAGLTVLSELLGLRARFKSWIHLSDGGHFENLGVYELLRRGCRRIVVVDASCDPDRNFADLANAIRRARIDLGIQVYRVGDWEIFGPDGRPKRRTLDPAVGGTAAPADATVVSGKERAWTWFEINYGSGLPRGRLLYIKPSVYKEQVLPVEVLHYWRESPSFPHESTADQFFTEQQMEAYRSLGERCVLDAMKVLDLADPSVKSDSADADRDLLLLVRRSLRDTALATEKG